MSKSSKVARFVPHQQLLSDEESNPPSPNPHNGGNGALSDDSSANADELGSPRDDLLSQSNQNQLGIKSPHSNKTTSINNSQLYYERNLENLNLCVDSIKGQFASILNKHETDFIRAYQSYMEKVQKELAFLQQKVNETLKTEMNDDYIASLNSIIDLFVRESENVNVTLNKQKLVFKQLKQEKRQIKRDRKDLKEQIKVEMRENKKYQIATNRMQKKSQQLREFLDINQQK